jgi:hypothetical protein
VPIAVSVVLEAIFLSLLGAAAGAAAAWLISNGRLNTAGSPVFENYVSPRLFAIGFAWALALRAVGSVFRRSVRAACPWRTLYAGGDQPRAARARDDGSCYYFCGNMSST